MNDTTKKKHLYCVTGSTRASFEAPLFVLAHTRQQAVNAVSSRFLSAERADAMDAINAGVKREDIIDATLVPTQEPLPFRPGIDTPPPADEPKTAAEVMEVSGVAKEE